MQKRISTLPFQGTKEQQEQLFKVIDENGGTHGSVMPILQKAQEIYGYLPIEVQTMIAEKMDVPLEEIYGVSTFYSLFALTPKGKYNVSVCMGTACYVKVRQMFWAKFVKCLVFSQKNAHRTVNFPLPNAVVLEPVV